METILKADIGTDEILSQNEQETMEKKIPITFDERNYLQATLKPGEDEKNITIRLLPFSTEGGTPFKKVHMHVIKVNKEIATSGWKRYVCASHNGYDRPCPFCEISEQAYKLKNTELDPIKKDKYDKIAYANRAKEFWVVRCIERGHEEDGPKFWLFPHSKKHDGVYDKIINIFKRRSESAKQKGKECNIFSLTEGKDLEITLSRTSDNKRATAIVDSDEKTPLSENIDLANKWIEDAKKWDDVFKVKPYDYMKIVLNGKVPIYDKDKKCYVEKLSSEEFQEQKEKEQNDQVAKTPDEFATQSDNEDNEDLPF